MNKQELYIFAEVQYINEIIVRMRKGRLT